MGYEIFNSMSLWSISNGRGLLGSVLITLINALRFVLKRRAREPEGSLGSRI